MTTHEPGPGDDALLEVRSWIDAAERIVVLTGAGISTDSGIPDFRGPQGVWTRNPEAEKSSTIQHYLADPEIRRRSWHAKLEMSERRREPNAGHRALPALDRRHKLHLLITQNVDGLHHEAGSNPERIVEIHGTMREFVCMGCDERGPIGTVFDRVRAGEGDPACRSCGGILKSATISFGQGLVSEDLARAEAAAETCDLLLAVGSTLGVYPIAGVVPLARQAGLRGSISEILPRIL
jgi:NAD-dependent deacetylase